MILSHWGGHRDIHMIDLVLAIVATARLTEGPLRTVATASQIPRAIGRGRSQ
jgi:hypothetical protein